MKALLLLLCLALPLLAAPAPAPAPAASPAPSAASSPEASAPTFLPIPTPTPLPPPAFPNWSVLDAPYRIGIRLKAAPEIAEAGVEINFQDNGQMRADLADLLLTDRDGTPQPIAKIGNRPGGRVILLAQKLDPNIQYYIYFGGGKVRTSPDWTPKTSLLMETRPAPKDLQFDSLQSLRTAWGQSPEAPGAAFVRYIYHGGNPFGTNAHFLTRYSGYLRLPEAREVTFYTLSSDCSFVIINDLSQFGWPGQHTAQAEPKTVAKKTVACPAGLVKIEYYAAKGDNETEGRLGAATVLGWQTPSGFEAIPAENWLHPGSSHIGALQTRDGTTLYLPKANVESYIAYSGQWLYETKFELRFPQKTALQGSATWEFPDGAVVSGTGTTRLLTGNDSQMIHCKWARPGGTTFDLPLRIDIPDRPQRASINNPVDVRRYLDQIDTEADFKLKPDAVRLRLAFLLEFGNDQEIARFAEKYPRENETEPLWFMSQLAILRARAQKDPVGARQAFGNLVASLQPATLKLYATPIATTEMDLLVFALRDPEGLGRLAQLAFIHREDAQISNTAKIRIGDLHRLLGHFKEAAQQYQSLSSTKKDPALAVKDNAASLAVRDLLEKGFAREAQEKLLDWERRRPMTKFDSDYLLLRARTWISMGRWREARAELESFQKLQPDHPFQIDARFYQARILFEQGSKEEARKIWNAFANDYPRHPLAKEAANWAKKP